MPEVECGWSDIPNGASGASLLQTAGPTLRVDVGFDQRFTANPANPPNLGLRGVAALIDTGASESCIDSSLAIQLNLPIIDRRTFSGAHGASELNIYLAHVWIPSLKFLQSGAFAGVHLISGGQPHEFCSDALFFSASR